MVSMQVVGWSGPNWFGIVQTVIVAGALLLIALGLFLEARARRVGNLIQLTQAHRDLWERMYSQPELSRILDPDAAPEDMPIRPEEEVFVIFLILHLSGTFYAMRSGFFKRPEGLRKDIERFFSLPIPRAVWTKVKSLQDAPFVRFVERCFPFSDARG
jgi:Family of unknown function (DUF6082)